MSIVSEKVGAALALYGKAMTAKDGTSCVLASKRFDSAAGSLLANHGSELLEALDDAARWKKIERLWSKQTTSQSERTLEALGLEGDVTLPLAEIIDKDTQS